MRSRFITVVVSFLSMMMLAMTMTMTTTTFGVVATSDHDIRSRRNSIVGTSIGGDHLLRQQQQQQRERDLVVSFDAFLPSFSYDEEAMVEVTMPTLTLLLNGVVPTGTGGDGSGSTTKAQPASTLFGEEGSGLGDVAYDTIQTTMNDYLDTVLAQYYENDTTHQYDFVKARTEVVEDRPFLWGPTTTGSVITLETILTFRDDENKNEEEDSGIGIGTAAANQLQQQQQQSESGSASRGDDERLGESDRNQSNGSDRQTNNPNVPSELELDYAAGYVWNDLSEFQKRLLVTTTIEQIDVFYSLTSITSQQDFPITTTPVTEAEKEIVVNTNNNEDGDPQGPEQPVNNQEEVEEGKTVDDQEAEEKPDRGDIVLEEDVAEGANTNIITAISESELKSNETERLNPLWPALIVGIAVFLCTIIMLGYRRQSSSRRVRKGGQTNPGVRVHDNLTLEDGGSGEEFEIEEDRFYNCVLDNTDQVQHDPEHPQRQEWRCLSSNTRRNNSLHNDNDEHENENDRSLTNNNIDSVHDDVVSIGRSASGGGGSALRSGRNNGGGGGSFRGRARCYNAARTRDTNTNTNANDAYSVSYKNVDDDGSVSEMGSGVGGGREGGDEGRSCFNGTRGMLFGKNKDKHDQQQRQVNVTIITGEDDVDEDYNSEEDNGDDENSDLYQHHQNNNQRKIDLTTRRASSSHLYYGEGQPPTQESWRNISPNGMSGGNKGNGIHGEEEEEEQDYCDLTPIEKKTFVTYMKSGMTLEEASSQVLLERSLGTNITTNLGHTPSGKGGEAVVAAAGTTTTAAHRTSPTRKKKKRKKKKQKEEEASQQQQQPTHQRPQIKPRPSAAVQKAQQLLSEIMVDGQTTMVQHDIPPPSSQCHQSNTMLLNNPCSSNNLKLLQGVADEDTDDTDRVVQSPIA